MAKGETCIEPRLGLILRTSFLLHASVHIGISMTLFQHINDAQCAYYSIVWKFDKWYRRSLQTLQPPTPVAQIYVVLLNPLTPGRMLLYFSLLLLKPLWHDRQL